MNNIIPGHMRAATWMLAVVLVLVTYYVRQRLEPVGGALILTLGFYLVDQAQHLARHHDDEPPTRIEKIQKKFRWFSVASGLLLVVTGASLMVRPWN